MVRRTIEGRAHVVGEAKTDAEAIRMAHKLKPDVILMDADLPPAGGVDTTRTIKAHHPEVEVVVIHGDEAESFDKGKSGASLFRKKIVRAKIQSVVHAATRDGRTAR